MTNTELKAYAQELAGLSADDFARREADYDAARDKLRAQAMLLAEERSRRARAGRVAEADAQHAKAGVAEVKGKAVR